jgi:N-acetylglutamate synthase-like GNAT family acetyltransferase
MMQSNSENMTSVELMVEAAEAIFDREDPFYHFSIDGERVGAICLDDYHEEDQICLSLVKVRRDKVGQGIGTMLLDMTCRLADEHGVEIYIEIVPTGLRTEAELIEWYAKRGFEPVSGGYNAEGPAMSRSPQPISEVESQSEKPVDVRSKYIPRGAGFLTGTLSETVMDMTGFREGDTVYLCPVNEADGWLIKNYKNGRTRISEAVGVASFSVQVNDDPILDDQSFEM